MNFFIINIIMNNYEESPIDVFNRRAMANSPILQQIHGFNNSNEEYYESKYRDLDNKYTKGLGGTKAYVPGIEQYMRGNDGYSPKPF